MGSAVEHTSPVVLRTLISNISSNMFSKLAVFASLALLAVATPTPGGEPASSVGLFFYNLYSCPDDVFLSATLALFSAATVSSLPALLMQLTC